MRQFLAVFFLGSALALFGIVTTVVPSLAAEISKQLIKCSTCGVEFTSQAGMEDHYITHPEHMKGAPAEAAKPLIKCQTCGVEFTSPAGIEEHLKTYPTHKVVGAAKPLIKCSTCGVEFTTLKEEQEHLKAHPEHKMVPEE